MFLSVPAENSPSAPKPETATNATGDNAAKDKEADAPSGNTASSEPEKMEH